MAAVRELAATKSGGCFGQASGVQKRPAPPKTQRAGFSASAFMSQSEVEKLRWLLFLPGSVPVASVSSRLFGEPAERTENVTCRHMYTKENTYYMMQLSFLCKYNPGVQRSDHFTHTFCCFRHIVTWIRVLFSIIYINLYKYTSITAKLCWSLLLMSRDAFTAGLQSTGAELNTLDIQ